VLSIFTYRETVLKNGKDEEIFSAGEVVAEQFHVSS
jgi:hypothetical protein